MLSFDASSFAIAGAIAAAGPIIIHLLNRRRFRTVSWAAMDFLREALERNRKILHIRDIILLALRMLAVVLFGLVLARPFFRGTAAGAFGHAVLLGICLLMAIGAGIALATSAAKTGKSRLIAGLLCGLGLLGSAFGLRGMTQPQAGGTEVAAGARAPVHGVVIVDNSRSMGVAALGGTLLDRAKGKAAEFIDSLAPESRITVIPLAGSETPFTLDAHRNKEDARQALSRINLVDAEGSIRSGLDSAQRAVVQSTDLPTKRVVLLTDLQANAWDNGIPKETLTSLDDLQIVDVTTAGAGNVWVSGLHLEDGLASAEVPSRLIARVQSHAASTSNADESFGVQVRLLIDGVETASQTIDMTPGQTREVEFSHPFDVIADPLKPSHFVATVTATPELATTDQLPADNSQSIVVPVVASLPVVFVDQYGREESLEKNRVGETYALRHLMAPRTSGENSQRRLIHIEHVRPAELTQELLETARLVVMAGVETPDESSLTLLRDYVKQGGPLVLLAGASFNPANWTERAWLDGAGVLPAPLDAKPIGVTPEEAPDKVQPFFAAFSSMQHDFFLVEGEDSHVLSSLFDGTPFFKAVKCELDAAGLERLAQADTKRFEEEKAFLDQYATRRKARDAQGVQPRAGTSSAQHLDEDRRYRELEPAWWTWRSPLPLVDRTLTPEQLAKQSQPRVLATYAGNGSPFVIERRIGAGRVVLFTSGVTSNWNLMRGSGAMYVFHRALCQMLEGTLPPRQFTAGQKVTLPVERRADARFTVRRPSGVEESLTIDAITADVSGMTVRRPLVAGTYLISTRSTGDTASGASADVVLEQQPLVVRGAEGESELAKVSPADLQQKLGFERVRVLTADEPIRAEGGSRRGQNLWKLCAWCVLACLLLEQLVLAWPSFGKKTSG